MNKGNYGFPKNRTYKPEVMAYGGINIPQPIVYRDGGGVNHAYNQGLPGTPGDITNSWTKVMLSLTYQTSDLSFLKYNPKYFLFVYQGNSKFGKVHTSNPKLRLNRKHGKCFTHPCNLVGSVASHFRRPTYKNFSGAGAPFPNGMLTTFDKLRTEWDVNAETGKQTELLGFDPLRWYWCHFGGSDHVGTEFFPWPVSDITNVSVTTHKNFKKWPTHGTGPVPRINLYVKFAIVVQNPSNTKRHIIGPMSDTVKIFPKAGYFNPGNDTPTRYYYTWGTKIV